MTAVILDGKALSEKIIAEVAEKVKRQKSPIGLAVIMIGNDPASDIYVRKKEEACKRTGIRSRTIRLPETTTQKEIIEVIDSLNADDSVTGMIVQLPLPKHFYVPDVIREIDPKKDVDGFHAYNLGKMFLSKEFEHLPPATPAGIIRLLDEYGINVEGMNAVVVGHSNIVGKPISVMLLNRNATVTTCHIYTKNLAEHTKKADLLIVAVGKPKLITRDMVKKGAIVIDVGTNRMPDGKLVGDVDFENVSKITSFITPVPGGIGPMTVAKLIENTLRAKERQEETP